MELIRGIRNQEPLFDLNRAALKQCEAVDAAIAYVTDESTLIEGCWNAEIQLRLWARYDHTEPVTTDILRMFLERKSARFEIKLVSKIFHSKVIWWRGFGVYIGSANLSQPAWSGNFEAGLFLAEDEVEEQGLSEPLEEMFDDIDDASEPLTEDVYEFVKSFAGSSERSKRDYAISKEFWKKSPIPKLASLNSITRKPKGQKKKEEFLKEWNSTLAILRGAVGEVAEDTNRPSWIAADTAVGTQVDQFIHAFYHNRVREGNRSIHHEMFQQNRNRCDAALREAMEWWKEQPVDKLQDEARVINEWAPLLRESLSKDRLPNLSEDDFAEVCRRIHALTNHSLRVSYRSFGLDAPLPKMEMDERIDYLAQWLYAQTSKDGNSVLEVLFNVLYGGRPEETPNRLFDACTDPSKKIPHLGVSTIGEMIGWAVPDVFPPRNGRTSKALKALGFNVKVHSE